jgi:hypothetical protein
MRARGQILVAAVLVVGLLVMSVLVTAYQAHALFLRTRSVVVRETAAAITADFERALAAMLALATRALFNYTRFSDFTSRFEGYGLEPGDLDSAKLVAKRFLEEWEAAARVVYAEKGAQVEWFETVCALPSEVGMGEVYVYDLMYVSWYRRNAGSFICAGLNLNLTNAGFYGWRRVLLAGFSLAIVNAAGSEVNVTARVDNGTLYGNLLARGWVEVYYREAGSEEWVKAKVKDMVYGGFGNYRIVLDGSLPAKGWVRVVASDERGILAVAEVSLG